MSLVVVDDLRDERTNFARLARRIQRAKRRADELISDGHNYYEQANQIAELADEVEARRSQPSAILRALGAGEISPEKAEELRLELTADRDDLEQSVASVQVPHPSRM